MWQAVVESRVQLKTFPGKPGGRGEDPHQDPETLKRDAEEKLFCRRCGHRVTGGRWRSSVGGDHEHTFFNPAGQVFRIGCFREAPGAKPVGPPSDEFTWFRGYRWRMAFCTACATQLGWFYAGEGPPPAFFGLILERLTTKPP